MRRCFPGRSQLFGYRLQVTDASGQVREFEDPYSFWPILSDFDLHLFSEGTHLKAYEKLGAHITEIGGTAGVAFAVWAPNARRVSVVGDFNSWDSRRHPMRWRPTGGIWELFIPGLGEGEKYKFDIKSQLHDYAVQKADPFSFYFRAAAQDRLDSIRNRSIRVGRRGMACISRAAQRSRPGDLGV